MLPGGDVRYGLGVDLGTSSVAAAISYGPTAETVLLGERSVVAPAVAFAREDGFLATGDEAARRGRSNPERLGEAIRRRLGDPTPVLLGGAPYPVPAILAAMLRDVMGKVVQSRGGPPTNVFLTRPASWDPRRRALFEQVAGGVGLSGAFTVTDAEAAAAHYGATHPAQGEIVAVYDLGGGTFDATVLRIGPFGPEILGPPGGLDRLGGVDFDNTILSYVNFSTGGALSTLDPHSRQTAVTLACLRQECIKAKETLTDEEAVTVPVFLPGRDLSVRLTGAGFEEMVRAPLEATIETMSRTLRAAGVAPQDLSAVLMVGGSTRIPLVGRMVSNALGAPRLVHLHPEHAVALGAAMLAARSLDSDPRMAPAPPPRPPSPRPRRPAPLPPPVPVAPPAGRPPPQPGPAVPLPDPAPPPQAVAEPADEHRSDETEWQAPPIGRTLVIAVVVVALAVVVGLIAYVVISRV